ncbi:MAG: potassium transporter TrkA, partial [Gammaproteobacteria bacterium]|nr:potassium transporter TrkA [Gammaproteobacteria bacterium]
WIKQKYDNTLVFVRTNDTSEFAQAVGEEHGVHCISITQLVEDNIPLVWLD